MARSELRREGERWAAALKRPRAFVLSGGASLGASQVGMLRTLGDAGLDPDLVVGTSVGALHAAVVAELGSSAEAATRLEPVWRHLRRRDVLPGGPLKQALHIARHGTLHGNAGVRRLVRRGVRARRFEQLRLPLTVVASNVLTGHAHRITSGDLEAALLATTALPGVMPHVEIDGVPLWDGGSVANVPLRAAVDAGAASVVVLDAADLCHRDRPPRGIPDGIVQAVATAMRQRVLVEAPLVADMVPVAYLPRPCTSGWAMLDFGRSHELLEPAGELVTAMLRHEEPPEAGRMAGLLHDHADPPLAGT